MLKGKKKQELTNFHKPEWCLNENPELRKDYIQELQTLHITHKYYI